MTFLQIFLTQVSIHGFAKTKEIVSRFFSPQSGISTISKFCPFRKIWTDHSWGFQFKQIQSTLKTRSEWVCNCNTLFLHLSLQFIPRDENHFVEKVDHGQWKTSNVGKTKWEKVWAQFGIWKEVAVCKVASDRRHSLTAEAKQSQGSCQLLRATSSPLQSPPKSSSSSSNTPPPISPPNILEGPDHLTSSQPSAEVRSQPAVAAVRPSLLSLWANQAHVTTRGLYISYFLKHHQGFFPQAANQNVTPPFTDSSVVFSCSWYNWPVRLDLGLSNYFLESTNLKSSFSSFLTFLKKQTQQSRSGFKIL